MGNIKFKIGDKVRVIDNNGYEHRLKLGEVLTITSAEKSTYDPLNGFFRFENKSDIGGLFGYRLELVEEFPNTKLLTLPTDSETRKDVPVFSGCIKYFPAAIAGVAKISKAGNDKHNPGQELHHDRSKSLDHKDCILRHLMDTEDLIAALERGQIESTEQILSEVNALAWRALAYSQSLHEKYAGAPLAPGAKLKKGNEND